MTRCFWGATAAGFVAASVAAGEFHLGYMLDISRNKVPKMEALYRMVDVLADLGYDQFQLYTEHTFAYRGHEAAWRDASPMTPDEIRALDAYCAARRIELVPNQNSFGHMERWLEKPEYKSLAEAPNAGVKTPFGVSTYPMALCPTDPASERFIAGLYDDLLPNFRSGLFNVGCDEVYDFMDADGPGRSAAVVREKGVGRVYLDFLLKIHALCRARGRRMMFWGDIVGAHPELVGELPKDMIALAFGYENDFSFNKRCALFAKSGLDFYVCPGTSAWNSLFGRHANMKGNVDDAFAAARKHGAKGLLLTDWGDWGHSQPWLSALPSLVYASRRVRGLPASDADLVREIDRLAGARCGEALLRFASLNQLCEIQPGNKTQIFLAFRKAARLSDDEYAAVLAAYDDARRLAELDHAPAWIRNAFGLYDLFRDVLALRAAGRDAEVPGLKPAYRRLWLEENRLGGLETSADTLFVGGEDSRLAAFWDGIRGRDLDRLPLDILPENAFVCQHNEDFDDPANRGVLKTKYETLAKQGTFNLVTLTLRCRKDLCDTVTVERVAEAAAFGRTNGIETVMDVDPRIARREFVSRWPDETQRFVQFALAAPTNGVARFAIRSDRINDHMSGGAADYSGWKAPTLFSAAALRLDATGASDPATRRDLTAAVRVTRRDIDLIEGEVAGLADGETLLAAAEFELFEADVCSPRLIPYTRELMARYARLPIHSEMRDEWGFAAPRRAMRDHRAFWFSPHFAAAYGRHSGGRSLVADLELLAVPARGRERERYAAIDAYMRTIFLRCAETEEDFHREAKRLFGAAAHVAKHPTWWTGFNDSECLHNGIDWWRAKRDWAQSDESVPLPVATALAKKFGGPVWLNECYGSDPRTYVEAVWRYAVGGGREVYHPMFGKGAPGEGRPYAEASVLSYTGMMTPPAVRAQARVRLVNLVSRGQADCPVAVVFGHSRLVNWDDPAYLDWGERLLYGLSDRGYWADLYPSDEFSESALRIDADGYLRMGRQRYLACCLWRLSEADVQAFEAWRRRADVKTRFFSYDSPETEGVIGFDGNPDPIVAALASAGAVRQTPIDREPFGIEGGWSGRMTPPDGTLRLTDGTVVRCKGCCPDPAGDPIEGVLETATGSVAYKARGVFAARLDEKGSLVALAAGGLERVEAKGLSLCLEKPLDLALVRRGAKWQGVVQSCERPEIPVSLLDLTADWSHLKLPTTLTK